MQHAEFSSQKGAQRLVSPKPVRAISPLTEGRLSCSPCPCDEAEYDGAAAEILSILGSHGDSPFSKPPSGRKGGFLAPSRNQNPITRDTAFTHRMPLMDEDTSGLLHASTANGHTPRALVPQVVG
mmetsp:Transcript_19307/g.47370  ORF Transcript_19307/g.47370 Transcript_19307/m.47370 type:complete len:125 (+) Transcript_19307:105-479(+)